MSKTKLGTIEAILIIVSILTPLTVISAPKTFINELKSGALLNIIYVTILSVIISIIIYNLFKKFSGSDIIDVSNFLGGKFLKILIGFIFISYLVINAAITLRDFSESLTVVYYPYTNVKYIILMFVFAIGLVNHFGFNSSMRTTIIIFPALLVSIILLFVGNLDNFSFNRIFPILGEGISNTFLVGSSNIGAFGGIIYLFILPPILKEPKSFKKISIISAILSGIFIFMCIAVLQLMFSIFINLDEIMPLFTVSRYIEFGTFFQRFESVFLLIWTISFCCYLSITCKAANYLFNKIFNLKDASPLVPIFTLLVFVISLIPKNYAIADSFEKYVYRYFTIALIFLGIFILFLSNIKNKKKVGIQNEKFH